MVEIRAYAASSKILEVQTAAISGPGVRVYRPDSDVDIYVHFGAPSPVDLEWWSSNNDEEFASINARLPGRLEILEFDDPLRFKIISAGKQPVHTDRNVICVDLPSHR